MKEWKKVRLGEICEIIQTGPFGSQLHQHDYSETGIPVIMPKDIARNGISISDIARIPDPLANRLSRYKVNEDDLVFARRGDVGRCVRIKQMENGWICGTGCIKASLKKNLMLSDFAFYYLNLESSQEWFQGHAVGATMPNLNPAIVSQFPIPLPPLPVQRAIAGRLSAYDNLIENNNKRIAILEKKAEGLYKEWFVRYRFPGYQKAKWVAGLPEGWKVERLGEVLEVKYGKDHKKIADGDIPIFGSGGIMRYGDKAIYEKEAVLIPRKGSLNNIMYYDKPFWTVDTMFYAVPLIPYFAKFAYYTLSEYDMESYNSGAALPSMTTDILRHFKIVIAPSKILKIFDQRVSQLFSLKANLQRQNALLAKKRDLLLPRLMSGRVSCSASERAPSQEEAAR